jgi:hypothetical protein
MSQELRQAKYRIYARLADDTIRSIDDQGKLCTDPTPALIRDNWNVMAMARFRVRFAALLHELPTIGTVVTVIHFDRPINNGLRARQDWNTTDRKRACDWFDAYLYRLDLPIWNQLVIALGGLKPEETRRMVVAAVSEPSPSLSLNASQSVPTHRQAGR